MSVYGCAFKSPTAIINKDIIAPIKNEFDDETKPTSEREFLTSSADISVQLWRRSSTMEVCPPFAAAERALTT
jgi:hypothetical protein